MICVTWIEGTPVTEPTEADVDAALRLVSKLVVLGQADGAGQIGTASAATFTGGEVVQQVECRKVKFRSVAADEPELPRFWRTSSPRFSVTYRPGPGTDTTMKPWALKTCGQPHRGC